MLTVDNYWLDFNGFTGYPQTYPHDVKKISTDYIKQKDVERIRKLSTETQSYPQIIHRSYTQVS